MNSYLGVTFLMFIGQCHAKLDASGRCAEFYCPPDLTCSEKMDLVVLVDGCAVGCGRCREILQLNSYLQNRL